MPIKHRGVKIVPIKSIRYEVRTIDGRKLKTFGSPSSAKAWIDGYVRAVDELMPRQAAQPATNSQEPPKRRRRVKAEGAATA